MTVFVFSYIFPFILPPWSILTTRERFEPTHKKFEPREVRRPYQVHSTRIFLKFEIYVFPSVSDLH